MRYRFQFTAEVDMAALADHDEDKPPPQDLDDWYDSDLIEAVKLGIVELDHAELELVSAVQGEDD
jgi:hypothetical protein